MLKNSSQQFGLIAILLHWICALAIVVLFALGLFMEQLDYNDPWYYRVPAIHESIGLLLFATMLARYLARWINPPPPPLAELAAWEQMLASLVHRVLYVVIFTVLISGYLISSAEHDSIAVFDWFKVPGLNLDIANQEDIAGEWHERIAWLLIALATFHALAAIKHHVIDKDRSLLRMLGINR